MSTVEVKVPDIGDFSDVPVIGILVKTGDRVAAEDPLIELESDKATMEVPSPEAGIVAEILVGEGDSVSEGTPILRLETEAETKAEAGTGTGTGTGTDGEGKAPEPETPKSETPSGDTPKADAPKADAPAPAGTPRPPAHGERAGSLAPVDETAHRAAHASPSVRAFARQLGVDLADLSGSGRKGRILREDVAGAFKARTEAAAPKQAAPAAQGGIGIPPIPKVDFSKFGPVEDVEMSRIKKISGPVLHRSWLNIPHVTHQEEADITRIDAWRRELDAKAKPEGYRVTLLSFAIKACVSALKTHWEVNASIHPEGDRLIRKNYWHIGFAADTPQGLMVPVIRNADGKGLIEISKELGALSAKARDGKLKPDEMQGASFTISSLGGIGGTGFTPIVNAPEVAILGLTRAKMAPVWDGEAFAPRLMLPMSLSYDHRAIDGALAARFCATLAGLLSDERRLIL